MTSEAAIVTRRTDDSRGPESGPLEILIVDDDPIFRHILRRMLMRGAAHRVAEAQHAEEAIDMIERQRPDLVVSDIFMPVADGFELLNWMRFHAAQIPVLVVSAVDEEDVDLNPLQIAQDLGAAGVLTKSFDRAELIAAIDRALEGAVAAARVH